MEITAEEIQNKLFTYSDIAQKFHHDTRSFAEHKALDFLYTELLSFRDSICELIIGYQNGKRIGKLQLGEVPDYSHAAAVKLATNIKDFAYQVEMWAEDKKYCDIENKSQELSGIGAKTLYLLSLT